MVYFARPAMAGKNVSSILTYIRLAVANHLKSVKTSIVPTTIHRKRNDYLYLFGSKFSQDVGLLTSLPLTMLSC